jgi:hypothetical protein
VDAVADSRGVDIADVRRAARALAADMLSRQTLSSWLDRYPALPVAVPRDVLVVMAGNIPFVGMHDLLCVLAAGHRAIVKPSSKDAGLMAWVVEQLRDISPEIPVSISAEDSSGLPTSTSGEDSPAPGAATGGGSPASSPLPRAVIAMGSDDAARALGGRYADIPTLLRGHRSSPAVLSGGESDDELSALADDVLSYSGLGCRNVSLVLLPRGYDLDRLGRALSRYRGPVGRAWRNGFVQARALLGMTGTPHLDCGTCLLVERGDFSSATGVLNYMFYDTSSEVADWLAERDGEIQCVACAATDELAHVAAHPRAVAIGRTQRPGPGDYPDGRDTMIFLTDL